MRSKTINEVAMDIYKRNSYLDCWDETDIICPYCYKEVEDYDCSVAWSENTAEVDCPHCGKTFYCVAEHKITYTSTRIDEKGKEISEWWEDK